MTKSYTSAGIESKLHEEITNDAKQNKISFSAQIKKYRDTYYTIKNGVN